MTLASRTSEVRFVKKGAQGNKGAKLRMTDWAVGQQCLEGKEGEEWYDVKVYNSKLYLCIKSHTSSTANNPQTSVADNLGYWALATDWEFVATKLLLAEKIKADQIDADGLTAKNVDISGKITATSGTIGGFNISEEYLGNIEGLKDGECGLRMDKSSLTLIKQSEVFYNYFQVTPAGIRVADIYVAADESKNGRIALRTSGSVDMVIKDSSEWIRIANMLQLSSNKMLIYAEKLAVREGVSDYDGLTNELSMTVGGYRRTLKFVKGILISVS